jgi:GNAT superfamily N-acetyltransferase
MTAFRIEKIAPHHAVEGFDCGTEALNRYPIRFALVNQRASTAQTYLGLADDQVIGFYTLVVGEVAFDDAPERLGKGLARHPIPIMLLARLAVSLDWQGRSLGAGLLKDAMRRTAQAADIAGIRTFAVHAKDGAAASFYQRFDFLPSPTDPLHLFLLLKDLRRTIAGES